MFKYYSSNTWTGLGYFRVSLYSSGVEIELSSYSTAVLVASQATRLGKGSSITARDEQVP